MNKNLTDYCAHCGHAQTHHQNGGKCVDVGCKCQKFAYEPARTAKAYMRWERVFTALALVMMAAIFMGSGYLLAQIERPGTWQPVQRVTLLDTNYSIQDYTGDWVSADHNVYVYECGPHTARITWNLSAEVPAWVERARLKPDVCLTGQP